MFVKCFFKIIIGLTQAQMISDSELSELISVPKEWRSGDERIVWPKTHDKFNIEWLENLWKYLTEYCKTDLAMMENFNIIYTLQSNKQLKLPHSETTSFLSQSLDKNLVLFKLSKNSSLVYTPPFNNNNNFSNNSDDNNTTIGAILLNSLNTDTNNNLNNLTTPDPITNNFNNSRKFERTRIKFSRL